MLIHYVWVDLRGGGLLPFAHRSTKLQSLLFKVSVHSKQTRFQYLFWLVHSRRWGEMRIMVYTFAANLLEDTLSGALSRSARVVKNEKKNSLRHTQVITLLSLVVGFGMLHNVHLRYPCPIPTLERCGWGVSDPEFSLIWHLTCTSIEAYLK